VRRTVPGPRSAPPATTVLKPLCGNEPRLYENLATFCEQDHPAYQLVFGVRSPDDPAVAVVDRLGRAYPERDIMLVIDPATHGTNLKVGNLINLVRHARHDMLVIADSDVSVRPDYLRSVVEPLSDPAVSAVTCAYRARPIDGFWPAIGALYIDQWFIPAVYVRYAMGSTRFGFGQTLVCRRSELAAMGGFDVLRDRLADDYWLAEGLRGTRSRTALSNVVVTTDVSETRFADLWRRETRWLRTIRSINPAGFAFLFITFTSVWLLLGAVSCAVGGIGPPFRLPVAALVGLGLLARGVTHWRTTRTWQRFLATAPLVLPRDVLLLVQWLVSLRGNEVTWRGVRMAVNESRGRA
jgi:ceramide glucosyltransferase